MSCLNMSKMLTFAATLSTTGDDHVSPVDSHAII